MPPFFRRMMRGALTMLAVLALGVPASEAQLGFQPTIAKCPECQPIANQLSTIRAERYGVNRRLDRLNAGGRRAGSLRGEELAKTIDNLEKRDAHLKEREDTKWKELQECERTRCKQTPDDSGGGDVGTTGTSGGSLLPACFDCLELVDAINTLRAELEALENTLNIIQEDQEALRAAAARAGGDPARQQGFKDHLERLDRSHKRAYDEQQQKAKALDAAEKKFDECNDSCGTKNPNDQPPAADPPKPPEETKKPDQTSFRDPRVIGGVGGAAMVVALLTGRNGTPAVAAAPPVPPASP